MVKIKRYWRNGIEKLGKFVNLRKELQEKVNYKDGRMDGLWEYFNEDGSLDKIEKYKDGELIE